jgi:hypothetical protein
VEKEKKTVRIEVEKTVADWVTVYAKAFGREPSDVATEALTEYRNRKIPGAKAKGTTA